MKTFSDTAAVAVLRYMESNTLRPSLLALLSTTLQLITPYNAGNTRQPAYQDNFHLP